MASLPIAQVVDRIINLFEQDKDLGPDLFVAKPIIQSDLLIPDLCQVGQKAFYSRLSIH